MRTNRSRRFGRSLAVRLSMLAFGAIVVVALGPSAFAQGIECDKGDVPCEKYRDATLKYTLGDYEEAVKLYRAGYELTGDPAFLFNIAQSYRMMGDCRNAIFFYKRFLLVQPKAENRDEVEERVKDLEENCKQQAEIASKPPEGVAPGQTGTTGKGTGQTGTTGGDTDTGDTDTGDLDGGDLDGGDTDVALGGGDGFDDGGDLGSGGGISAGTVTETPAMVVSQVLVGPAFLGMGDSLDTAPQFSLAIGAGYPIQAGPALVDAGALITYTPVPWNNNAGAEGTASLVSILGNVGASYPVTPEILVRGELGLGVLLFSGLDSGNLFTMNGAPASGALSMFNVRFALGASYLVTPNLAVNASPVIYSYSPAKEGLREDIDALTRFELMLGVGYRM
jgi:hypothetical protein